MTRPDGRSDRDLRPLIAEFDDLARVDGSARFGFGEIPSALASLTGPIEARLAAEHPSRLSLDVLLRPLSGIPGVHEKKTAAAIGGVLKRSMIMEASPRTAVILVVQSLCDGESLASMINASSMACMSAASIPMRGVVCAVSVGLSEGNFVVDPSTAEEKTLSASGCFAFHIQGPDRVECVWTNWKGTNFEEEELLQARALAKDAAAQVWMAIRQAVSQRQGAPLSIDEEDKMEI